MRVRVLQPGYDGERLYQEGDVFDWPNGPDGKPRKLGSWVQAVADDTPLENNPKKATRVEPLPNPHKSNFRGSDPSPI